ncbi:MAG: hypothetical protein HY806_05475 [Nitrospirae bacterium]|nr:hypothetical protein [Nitrospirota bacterium]MBI4838585.1 hypothetical protein [Nitrospirota bacterium]
MIDICGIGWIDKEKYGCIAAGERVVYKDSSVFDGLSKKIFPHPFKNFGRLDKTSKLICYAAALALKDAGINYSQKQDMGIIGANDSGSLESDLLYFKDYLDCGRTLSRGNLFIYTLPSSPLGEAAIHFGLQGPLFYTASRRKPLSAIMTMASDMILSDETSAMLAGLNSEENAVYLILKKSAVSGSNFLCHESKIKAIAGKDLTFNGLIKKFSDLRKGQI